MQRRYSSYIQRKYIPLISQNWSLVIRKTDCWLCALLESVFLSPTDMSKKNGRQDYFHYLFWLERRMLQLFHSNGMMHVHCIIFNYINLLKLNLFNLQHCLLLTYRPVHTHGTYLEADSTCSTLWHLSLHGGVISQWDSAIWPHTSHAEATEIPSRYILRYKSKLWRHNYYIFLELWVWELLKWGKQINP